ncbi:hypothetical protein ONS95_003706 [Cadophora gregata]|uniref:uncharacterized protein n=1 Tax=Cadophora gregata TaxID=51156 RepID=UPI0026DAB5BD|nr:uncharacterized protein ONS95_003706 [Cadophora gregata]KAK0106991.1 hypothetical protein ONS95_003706 [Cadophora gregata]KAK0116682.1 hypothetical protein ONS96_012534 [Cadophora gregata f. sp. sojae]
MSRITPPVTKFTHAVRSISSSANAGRPSGLLDAQSRASRYLPRNLKDLRAECKKRQLNPIGNKNELVDRLAAHDIVGSQTQAFHTTGMHRPTSTAVRTIPLMQGFRTSAPKQASRDNSTIDFFFFPEVPAEGPVNPFQKLRVPLLPDNYNPDRSPESAHALEALDEAVPRPEISIMAAHPENVAPSAMSEVVGNDGLDLDIGQLTSAFSTLLPTSSKGECKEPGVIKELWSGLLDDILGPKTPKAAV